MDLDEVKMTEDEDKDEEEEEEKEGGNKISASTGERAAKMTLCAGNRSRSTMNTTSLGNQNQREGLHA